MKLAKPTERQAEALKRLQANGDFKVVVEWLNDSIQQIREQNDSIQEETSFRRNQGALWALKSLLEHKEQAGEILQRYRSR